MRFVRVALNHTAGIVIGVDVSEVPFRDGGGGRIVTIGHECEMVDLGVVEDHVWIDEQGRPASPAQHIHCRMTSVDIDGSPHALIRPHDVREKRASADLHVEGLYALAPKLALREIHDIPCTIGGLQAHLRAGRKLHGKIRAWLAYMLPQREVDELGLASGINFAALKWADSVRAKRDPHHGSIRVLLDRAAQAASDELSLRHHVVRRRRHATELAAAARDASGRPLVLGHKQKDPLPDVIAALDEARAGAMLIGFAKLPPPARIQALQSYLHQLNSAIAAGTQAMKKVIP